MNVGQGPMNDLPPAERLAAGMPKPVWLPPGSFREGYVERWRPGE